MDHRLTMGILVIDSATPQVGVAFYGEHGCEASMTHRILQGADAWLGGALAQLLGTQNVLRESPAITSAAIDTVAVVVGPGSFTGLRVGVATALGVALARNLRVVPISALALRATLAQPDQTALVLLEARKGYVYAGLYAVSAGIPTSLKADAEVAIPQLLEWVADIPVDVVLGEGCKLSGLPPLPILPDPGQSAIATAHTLVRNLPSCSITEVSLRYLRDPEYHAAGVNPAAGA